MAVITLVTNYSSIIYTNETIQELSKYKYTYYQNTHTIVKTPTHYNTHTYTHTHTLQNPHVHTITYYKTKLKQTQQEINTK